MLNGKVGALSSRQKSVNEGPLTYFQCSNRPVRFLPIFAGFVFLHSLSGVVQDGKRLESRDRGTASASLKTNSKGRPMQRSREKRSRDPALRQLISTSENSAARGFVRSRIEGKKIGHSPVTFIRRNLAEISNMIRPPTKLARWSTASRVTGRGTPVLQTSPSPIPRVARSNYPIAVLPKTTSAAPLHMHAPASARPRSNHDADLTDNMDQLAAVKPLT